MNIRLYVLLTLLTGLLSCTGTGDSEQVNGFTGEEVDSLSVTYAEGFSAVQKDGVWYLTIHKPFPNAKEEMTYLLVPRDKEVPEHAVRTQVIRTPVRRIVATSTTHVPLLDHLDATNTLVGFPNPDFISSRGMRARIDSGHVTNVGMDQAMEAEKILSLTPDLIMAYSMSSDLGELQRLRKAGIPFILNADFLEPHPLGRSEWVKVAGLLLGEEKKAGELFTEISENYLKLTALVAPIKNRPTVLSGIVYGDTWFMPGGNNYAARLMEDAAMTYLWADNPSSGFLELSFESVLEKAKTATLWIGVASFGSLEEMKAAEPRYAEFDAFKNRQVYTYTKRIGATGGNEYLELGYLRPDLILGDLISIAHPLRLPSHTTYFYDRLK